MTNNIKDQISQKNVKVFIKHYLDYLKNEGFTLFQMKPSVEIFPKTGDLIGIALIDGNHSDIRIDFVNDPQQGDDFLHHNKK